MSGKELDPKNYCGGKAPEYGGDGYSEFRSDCDTSPEYLKEKQAKLQDAQDLAPDYIKQAIAESQKQARPA